MQKILSLSFFFIGFCFLSHAQEIADHTIGMRVGDNKGFGVEIAYQHFLEENKRLDIGLAWHNGTGAYIHTYKLTGLHQWVWELEDNFNWYAGAGSGIGKLKLERYYQDIQELKRNTFIFIAGNIGVEYNFIDLPLLLSLDFRPEIGFGQYRDDLSFDIALALRYKF